MDRLLSVPGYAINFVDRVVVDDRWVMDAVDEDDYHGAADRLMPYIGTENFTEDALLSDLFLSTRTRSARR